MAPRIDILDALDLHRLPALTGQPESRASRYVVPIVAAGVGAFVDNADVEMRALVINGKVLPLVISHGTAGNADVCSPYAHYIQYTTEEAIKRWVSVPARLTRLTMSPLAALLRAGRIDGVLFVNNWLFATNPSSGLTGPGTTTRR